MSQTPQAPERIHGWLDSQLSIARFYGGISYNGQRYSIAYQEPGQPLVRDDVLQREARLARSTASAQRRADKARRAAAQGGLV